jgi:hypothetical protein
VYNSDMIILVLFSLTENVQFTNALNSASNNVVKYLWLGSKLVVLKCSLFSVILIGVLKFVIVM